MKDAENSKLLREIDELKESIQDVNRLIEEQSQNMGIKEAAVDELQRKLDHYRKKAGVLDSMVTRIKNENFASLQKAQNQRMISADSMNCA